MYIYIYITFGNIHNINTLNIVLFLSEAIFRSHVGRHYVALHGSVRVVVPMTLSKQAAHLEDRNIEIRLNRLLNIAFIHVIYLYTHTCTHAPCIHSCIQAYIRIHTCVHACMHTYIRTYIRVHHP